MEFPIGELDWLLVPDPSQEALAYSHFSDAEFTIAKTRQLVNFGDTIIRKCGSHRKSVREIQELNLRQHDYGWGNLEEDGRYFERFPPQLAPMLEFGVTLDYYGARPNPTHSPNYPHNRGNSIEILNKFRKLPHRAIDPHRPFFPEWRAGGNRPDNIGPEEKPISNSAFGQTSYIRSPPSRP